MTTITLSYLFISIAIVVVVAGTLYRNGREFLVDCFEGNEPLADAINRMLVVGFIVTKASYAMLFPGFDEPVDSPLHGFVLLATKIGFVCIVLGGMHLTNLWLFSAYRVGRRKWKAEEVKG